METELEGELNLTAYLDVVTSLVMFMLFAFNVASTVHSLPVDPPGMCAGCAGGVARPLLTVQESSFIISFDGARTEVVKPEELTATLRALKADAGLGPSITLAAAPAVRYARVVEAMDAARGDGSDALFPDVVLAITR